MTKQQELRVAVALMAHLLDAHIATVAHLAESIPDEELRMGALKDLDEHAKVAGRLAAMFPPESIPPEDRKIIFH